MDERELNGLNTEQFINIIQEKDSRIAAMEKELNDAKWFLGEETDRVHQLEHEVLQRNGQLSSIQEELAVLRKYCSEIEWYLGEEKARAAHLDGIVQDCQQRCAELEGHLNNLNEQYAVLQRDTADTRCHMGEARASSN